MLGTESFTGWLIGVLGQERNVLVSPLLLSTKSSNEFNYSS